MPTELQRCPWAKSPLMQAYHDHEWGVPVHDDRLLFEFLILEGAQAGLSWETILNKRENYRRAFDQFDARKIARYRDAKRAKLLADAGIVRNRLKIAAAIQNAQAFLAAQKEFGSFDQYIWQFVDHQPRRNKFRSLSEVPARTPESDAMSKDLLRRGFKFVGSTICYAFMQATGMVNDHLRTCFRAPPDSVRGSASANRALMLHSMHSPAQAFRAAPGQAGQPTLRRTGCQPVQNRARSVHS